MNIDCIVKDILRLERQGLTHKIKTIKTAYTFTSTVKPESEIYAQLLDYIQNASQVDVSYFLLESEQLELEQLRNRLLKTEVTEELN